MDQLITQEEMAMIKKYLLCPQRVRKPPKQFSWIDQRLVRDGYIGRCSHQALALYLFLVTVADAKGLSFYSDASLIRHLVMDYHALDTARQNLIRVGLVQYAKPLYQVLALDVEIQIQNSVRTSNAEPMSLGQIFKHIMEKTP